MKTSHQPELGRRDSRVIPGLPPPERHLLAAPCSPRLIGEEHLPESPEEAEARAAVVTSVMHHALHGGSHSHWGINE